MSEINLNEFGGHTPGPWYLDDAPDVKHPSVILADDGATIVAEAMTVVAEQHDAEANARLIAAAPDLLDLLKDARRMVKELHAMLDEDDAYEWAVRNIGHTEMTWWNPEA